MNKNRLEAFSDGVPAIPFAYIYYPVSGLLFFLQSGIWLIPDKNIEKALNP
jgi:hypothetical protein